MNFDILSEENLITEFTQQSPNTSLRDESDEANDGSPLEKCPGNLNI